MSVPNILFGATAPLGVVVAGCRILPSVVVSVFAGLSFLLVIWLDVYD